jgi:hypothetical protein
MRTPPQNETEYWDRVIEFAATANDTTTTDECRSGMHTMTAGTSE